MQSLAVFLIVFIAFTACASRPPKLKTYSSKEDFISLVQPSNLQSSATFSKSWNSFEKKYSDIYSDLFPQNDPVKQEKKQIRLERFRLALQQKQSKIINFYEKAENIIDLQFSRFINVFPDVQSGASVFVIPSLGTFNGRVIELPSKQPALLIGLDQIAETDEDLDVLFSHEIFHIYHSQQMVSKTYWRTLATAIWLEGFATYVSGQLNPQKSAAIILMSEGLARKCNDPSFIKERAASYLKIIDKTQAEDPTGKIYASWFNADNSPMSRSGYCLGWVVLKEIGKSNSNLEMVKWDEDLFSSKIKESLRRLADK